MAQDSFPKKANSNAISSGITSKRPPLDIQVDTAGGANLSYMKQFINKRNQSLNNESLTSPQQQMAFTVIPGVQKPSPSRWSKTRLDDLVQLPKHRPPRDKRAMLPPHLRNNSPMTMEDKHYIHTDLDLRNGLRAISGAPITNMAASFGNTMSSLQSANKTNQNATFSQTIPNPPSFYDDDIEKWRKKFQKHVQERQVYKKLVYQTQELTSLTTNTNLIDQSLLYGTTNSKDLSKADTSTFKRVMQRRKSRQSTFAPSNVDIDYVGDSGKFSHLMNKRGSNGNSPTCSQLNFEMKLRNYKNDTSYKAAQPWQFPPKKVFQAQNLYQDKNDMMSQTLKEFKSKYNDNFPEKNQSHTRELIDKHIGVMQSSFWEFNLRSDKKKKNQSQAPAKSKERQQ